jgi:hypothetical protein
MFGSGMKHQFSQYQSGFFRWKAFIQGYWCYEYLNYPGLSESCLPAGNKEAGRKQTDWKCPAAYIQDHTWLVGLAWLVVVSGFPQPSDMDTHRNKLLNDWHHKA